LLTLTGHTKAANSAAFSPDGRRIVSGSDDQTVRVWDASTGAQLQLLRGHTDDVLSVAFSPDGSRILSSGADDTARVWDASTGASIAVMRGDTDWLRHAAFSPDGKHVVSASDDKSVRVWDAASGAQLALIDGHTDAVNWAAYSPDGARIVSASDDRTVRIWDAAKAMTAVAAPAALQTNSPERNRIVGTWKAKWGTEFTFTADGKASNTAGHSGTWTYDGGQNYTETYTPGGAGNVWKLAMAPDGKSYIITNETGAPEDNRVLKQ
jgi:WD40 repeat protein